MKYQRIIGSRSAGAGRSKLGRGSKLGVVAGNLLGAVGAPIFMTAAAILMACSSAEAPEAGSQPEGTGEPTTVVTTDAGMGMDAASPGAAPIGGGAPPTQSAGGVDAGAGGGGAGSGGGALAPMGFCTPMTCEDRDAACGTIADGCGGVLQCGTCVDGLVCDAQLHQCVETRDICEMTGQACGVAMDACGEAVPCGTCEGGNVCNAQTGSCGPCQPRTCEDLNACGELPDGCGGSLDCGECENGLRCDVVSKRCSPCEPTTCEAEGIACGTISDGCGGTLDCDAEVGCPRGLACVHNACRPPEAPMECMLQMANCGSVTHSCSGDELDCGECPDGERCVGNRCELCVPRTCEELGLQCGQKSDGCGGKLSCGSCPTYDDDGQVVTCHNNLCCTPRSCPDNACGSLSDGCGGTLECGNCPTTMGGEEQICGLVTANVCTPCTRKTCEPGQCGKVKGGDGCGGELRCGSCPQDGLADDDVSVCGLVTANVCDVCTKTKTSCAADECGRISDGCRGRIDCGGCPDGQACGLTTANVCSPCTPKSSCGPDECGTISDGCGGEIDCGGCEAGKQCGLVTANLCSVCTPQTSCAPDACGSMSDGCGGTVNCGFCGGGEACHDNRCCVPKTCNDPSVGCDTTDDGCGGSLDCSCVGGQVCDANGTCCAPLTCPDVCANGAYDGPDLCGGTLRCDACTQGPT